MDIDIKDFETVDPKDLQPIENNMSVPSGIDVEELLKKCEPSPDMTKEELSDLVRLMSKFMLYINRD